MPKSTTTTSLSLPLRHGIFYPKHSGLPLATILVHPYGHFARTFQFPHPQCSFSGKKVPRPFLLRAYQSTYPFCPYPITLLVEGKVMRNDNEKILTQT